MMLLPPMRTCSLQRSPQPMRRSPSQLGYFRALQAPASVQIALYSQFSGAVEAAFHPQIAPDDDFSLTAQAAADLQRAAYVQQAGDIAPRLPRTSRLPAKTTASVVRKVSTLRTSSVGPNSSSSQQASPAWPLAPSRRGVPGNFRLPNCRTNQRKPSVQGRFAREQNCV